MCFLLSSWALKKSSFFSFHKLKEFYWTKIVGKNSHFSCYIQFSVLLTFWIFFFFFSTIMILRKRLYRERMKIKSKKKDNTKSRGQKKEIQYWCITFLFFSQQLFNLPSQHWLKCIQITKRIIALAASALKKTKIYLPSSTISSLSPVEILLIGNYDGEWNKKFWYLFFFTLRNFREKKKIRICAKCNISENDQKKFFCLWQTLCRNVTVRKNPLRCGVLHMLVIKTYPVGISWFLKNNCKEK